MNSNCYIAIITIIFALGRIFQSENSTTLPKILYFAQTLEQLKSEQSKWNRFGDVREENLVQESETREAGLLAKITDLESDLRVAKKGERRAVNEVDRLSSQNGNLLKEVEKQHEELKKVKTPFLKCP